MKYCLLLVAMLFMLSCHGAFDAQATYVAKECTTKSNHLVPCMITLTIGEKEHFVLKSGDKEIKGSWEAYDDKGNFILNLKRIDKYENIELVRKGLVPNNTLEPINPSQLLLPDSIESVVLKRQ